jgi:hypothetical protein
MTCLATGFSGLPSGFAAAMLRFANFLDQHGTLQ